MCVLLVWVLSMCAQVRCCVCSSYLVLSSVMFVTVSECPLAVVVFYKTVLEPIYHCVLWVPPVINGNSDLYA